MPKSRDPGCTRSSRRTRFAELAKPAAAGKSDIAFKSFWIVALLVGAALSAAILLITLAKSSNLPRKDTFTLASDLYRSLFVGTAVAMAGTLLPLLFKESRESIDQLKAAREAYSEAKTGLDYLHARVSSLPLTEAVAVVQSIHQVKHTAETYAELQTFIINRTVTEWSESAFNLLLACRLVLEDHADTWDQMKPSERLRALKALSPTKRTLTDADERFRVLAGSVAGA